MLGGGLLQLGILAGHWIGVLFACPSADFNFFSGGGSIA